MLALSAGPIAVSPVGAADDPPPNLHRRVAVESALPGTRIAQSLEIEGCEARLATTVWAEPEGRRRMVETERFEIARFPMVADGAPGSLELTARRYFTEAGDRGLARWLAELAETRDDPDRGARMRELQLRVERGEFGAFARLNGYEMRSYLEGDPEPYYAMPLPAVSLTLPEDDAEAAMAAWRAYAGRCAAEPL